MILLVIVAIGGITGWFVVAKSTEAIVIGVEGASIYTDDTMKDELAKSKAGTRVKVLELQDKIVNISTGHLGTGWIQRYMLCSKSEFEKRKAAGHVPHKTIILGQHDNGNCYVYGGEVRIRNDAVVFEEGQGIYCDSSVAKPISFGKSKLTWKPDILYYVGKDAMLLELPILATRKK